MNTMNENPCVGGSIPPRATALRSRSANHHRLAFLFVDSKVPVPGLFPVRGPPPSAAEVLKIIVLVLHLRPRTTKYVPNKTPTHAGARSCIWYRRSPCPAYSQYESLYQLGELRNYMRPLFSGSENAKVTLN
jgi:hypothetical protein